MIWLLALALADPIGPMPRLPYDEPLVIRGTKVVEVPDPAFTLAAPPVLGEEVVVTVADAFGDPAVGRTVQVFHRPGLHGQRQIAIGITDSRGKVRWTPEVPGVARLQAGDDALPIVIGGPVPSGTLTVLGLLVVLGVAAVGWATPRRTP